MISISRSLSLSLLLRNGTMSLFIVGDVAVCIYLVYLVFVNVINDHCMIIKRHMNDTRSRLLCYKSVCLLATISSARGSSTSFGKRHWQDNGRAKIVFYSS